MTIVAIVVGLLIAIALIWFLVTRASSGARVTHADFDDTYDDLVAKGEAAEPDREAAWRDFDAWQVENERERLRWEEAEE